MTSARIQRIAERIVPPDQFKQQRFPRDLEGAQLHLPLAIVEQEHLNFAAVLQHAPALNIDADSAKRPLRGCVICSQGSALVFIEKLDDLTEKLFTAAHELGHFVAHYVEPRELALERFGAGIRDLLDGKRPASNDERIAGVLSRCPIGPNNVARSAGRFLDALRAVERRDLLVSQIVIAEGRSMDKVSREEVADLSQQLDDVQGLHTALGKAARNLSTSSAGALQTPRADWKEFLQLVK
jgi:hypothetical protein